jgi:hypothetical protein
MEALSGVECYRLLATQQVGRLGVDVGRYPLIFPVNYALDGDAILVRTRPDTALTAADYANVAFEVDAIDPRTRSGGACSSEGSPRTSRPPTAASHTRTPADRSHGRQVNTAGGYGSFRTGSVVGASYPRRRRAPIHRRDERCRPSRVGRPPCYVWALSWSWSTKASRRDFSCSFASRAWRRGP